MALCPRDALVTWEHIRLLWLAHAHDLFPFGLLTIDLVRSILHFATFRLRVDGPEVGRRRVVRWNDLPLRLSADSCRILYPPTALPDHLGRTSTLTVEITDVHVHDMLDKIDAQIAQHVAQRNAQHVAQRHAQRAPYRLDEYIPVRRYNDRLVVRFDSSSCVYDASMRRVDGHALGYGQVVRLVVDASSLHRTPARHTTAMAVALVLTVVEVQIVQEGFSRRLADLPGAETPGCHLL